jgi:hypothetical protein
MKMRYLIVWFTLLVTLNAITVQELAGNWSAYRESTSNGTVTVEKEYLHLNANNTFSIQLFVSVQKEEAFIKDLRIEGSGIWKSRDNTLVIYIQKVEVPFAKEIYLISQESLRTLANNFKHKYENEPLRIIKIKSFTSSQLVTSNEALLETVYTRQ